MSRRPRQDVRHLKTPLACRVLMPQWLWWWWLCSDYNMQMETTPRGPNPCWGWGGAAAATRDYRVSGYWYHYENGKLTNFSPLICPQLATKQLLVNCKATRAAAVEMIMNIKQQETAESKKAPLLHCGKALSWFMLLILLLVAVETEISASWAKLGH